MHCNALKFHKLWPTSRRRRCRRGGEGCKSVPHILRFQISAAYATPHTRVCHFGSSRKRNYRKSEFKAKWPMALALANVLGKNFQLVTRTLPARVIKRERGRDRVRGRQPEDGY